MQYEGSEVTVIYRCRRCSRTYTPEEANRAAFLCHGLPMEREHVADAKESGNGSMRPLAWADANGSGALSGSAELAEVLSKGWVVRRIIPPPDNDKDAAAVEQLLGSLHGTPGPLSLEIAGDARQRQMLVRGSSPAVDHVVHQLQAAYSQVSWEDPGDDDPARCLLNSGDHADKGHPLDAAHVAHRRLELRRAIFYPIKTWREFDEADPLRVLLGAFRGLEPGELLFSQLVLLRPAPDDWSDAYQGSAQDVDFRMKAASAAGQARAGLFALGIILGSLDLAMLFASVGVFFRPSVGFLDVLKVVGGLGLLAAINAGLAVPAWRAWRALTARLNANPQVVQHKVSLPAFECELRLWAVALTPERSEALMHRLASAYRLYNLADGNALSLAERQDLVAPHILPSAPSALGTHHPIEAIRRALGEPQGLAAGPGLEPGRVGRSLAHAGGGGPGVGAARGIRALRAAARVCFRSGWSTRRGIGQGRPNQRPRVSVGGCGREEHSPDGQDPDG